MVRMTGELKIISWNLLHTKGARLENLLELIAGTAPDVVLLQEATAPIDLLADHIGGAYERIVLPGRQHGLATWSRNPFQTPALNLTLQRGVIVRRVCQIIDLGPFTIANVHLSHGQVLNRRQLRRIAEALPPRAAILGDCNMVGPPLLPGFKDVGARKATHRSARLVPLRLDRCFVRGLTCLSAETLTRGQSDHRPLLVVLSCA
jgi:endonuclease/exonuclease/phosphatase family metal-dependent hydrolase